MKVDIQPRFQALPHYCVPTESSCQVANENLNQLKNEVDNSARKFYESLWLNRSTDTPLIKSYQFTRGNLKQIKEKVDKNA